MKNELRLGRLVQCRCTHTCLPNGNHGFQWLLPRTKSKHMLYQQIQQKNKEQEKPSMSVDQLQQQLSSFSFVTHSDRTANRRSIKKKSTFKIPILLENELKRKITASSNTNNMVLKEFFVKTSYN